MIFEFKIKEIVNFSKKKVRSQSLFRALERVIPDLRDRIVLELIGTPLTHAHYLRRYQGTYGLAFLDRTWFIPRR